MGRPDQPRHSLLTPPLVFDVDAMPGLVEEINECKSNPDYDHWTKSQQLIELIPGCIFACHLDLPGVDDASGWVEFGASTALDYFCGDWQVEPNDEDPGGPLNLKQAREQRLDDLPWFREFSPCLFMAVLTGRREDAAKLCEWPWAELVPEYSGMGGPLEDEYALMYLLLASGLRESPMEGIDKVRARVRKCRLKRPKLLLTLWDAVEAGDQAAFDKAMVASLAHHDGGPGSDDDSMFEERLALPQSIMHQTALWRGLAPTELPDKLDIYLVTRSSLGLES